MIQRSKIIVCNLLIIITLSVWSNSHAQEMVDTIIQNHLRVTGIDGLTNEMKDYQMEGQLMQSKIAFPINIKGIIPDKYRMDMVFKQRTFVKISNGNQVWEYNPFTDTTTTGKCNGIEAQSFINHLCGSLIDYKNGKATARFLESTTIDDIEVYKIELKDKESNQIYFIDKYSYLIIRIDDDYVENKITYYSDYRKVGNYYLPFSITGYENGMPVMSMKFSDIKINLNIPPSEFSKPK